MASKPKQARSYVVHHRGRELGFPTVLGRYRVGAKNEKEAEQFLRDHIGKHAKVKVYFEMKKHLLPRGMVIEEWKRGY